MKNTRVPGTALAMMFVAVGVVPVCAQPQDVIGWGKIKWGATIDEVKALYPDLRPIQETVVTGQKLLFNDFELTPSQTADVTVFVGTNVGVTDINLIFTKEGGRVGGTIIRSQPGSVPATARRGVFDDMKKLLLEKYGTPKSDETRMEGSFERIKVLWLFPTTSIELQLSQSVRSAQLGTVAITYRIVGKNPL